LLNNSSEWQYTRSSVAVEIMVGGGESLAWALVPVPILIGLSISRWGRSVESQLKDTRQSDAAAARQSRGLFALIPIERTTHGGQVKRLRRRTTSSATPRAIGRRPPKRARGRRWSTVPPHVRMTRPRLSEFETAPMSLLCADSDTRPARPGPNSVSRGMDGTVARIRVPCHRA
jgi:hypothetical protein